MIHESEDMLSLLRIDRGSKGHLVDGGGCGRGESRFEAVRMWLELEPYLME